MQQLIDQITICTLCADKFSKTKTTHQPRPVVWLSEHSRILIAGQAPGARVHESGRPFTDPSGDRLRDWLGVSEAEFYNTNNFGILPMAFCFPGYNAAGHDLPPPSICASTWRETVLSSLEKVELVVLIGSYAQSWHLQDGQKVSDRLQRWRDFQPSTFVVPHPSWRNNAWLKRNLWFDGDLVPCLQNAVRQVIGEA